MSQSTKNNSQPMQSQRGAILSSFGSIVSALMASACCWLPLLLLAFGVSGAGIASSLEAWRPVFIIVTFSFLAAAFYFTYRSSPKSSQPNGDCGISEADCCKPSGRLFGWKSINKLMLWAVTVLAVVFLFFPGFVKTVIGTNTSPINANMNQSVFEIDGMTCEGCEATVAHAIKQVPGVLGVDVSYEKRKATVGVQSNEMVPAEAINKALRKAGYHSKKLDTN